MESTLPVQQKERIVILDAIRGVALCGILILNIGFFSGPYQWGFNLDVHDNMTRPNIISWYLTNFIFEGSFRALFSMLFGAGSLLLISRLEKSNPGLKPADIFYKRLIWLLIFGLINAFVLLWPGDILYSYAVCGLFIFPLRNLSPRLLVILAFCFIGVMMFKSWLSRQNNLETREKGLVAMAIEAKKDSLTEEQKSDLSKWKEKQKSMDVETIRKKADKEMKEMKKDYVSVWQHLKPLNQKFESSVFYEEIFFDVIIFILLGMAFFKMGLLTGEKPLWLYGLFILVGYSSVLALGYYQGHLWLLKKFDYYAVVDTSVIKISLYQIRRIFFSLGHVGVLILLWKSGMFNWLITMMARVGQMAFSNYLGQSIICTLYFYGYGFNQFGVLERYQLGYFISAVWAFQIAFSNIWLIYFRFGPLEWVWRSLTYWKIQPIRRSAETVEMI